MIAMSSTRVTNVNDGQDGAQGAQGPQGVSVTNVVPEYRLSDSSSELTGSGTGYTWAETKPEVTAQTYLWTRNRNEFSDNTTNYSDAICDITTTNVIFNVDQLNGEIIQKVEQSDINTAISSYDNNTVSTIRNQVSQHTTDISGITSRVSSVETTTGSLGTRMTAAETQIQQTDDTVSLLASVTTDGQTQQSTITLTPEMISAVSDSVVIKDPDGNATIIQGGQIETGAITTDMIATGAITANTIAANAITTAKLSTDAIKSTHYSPPTQATQPFSAAGTFLDLANGNIYSPSFVVDNTEGNEYAYFKGNVVADSGSIGGWVLTDSQLYSSITVDNDEYYVYLQTYDPVPTVIISPTVTSNINMVYNTADGVFSLTPTADGYGTFSFTYNVREYPTSELYLWDGYSSSNNASISVDYMVEYPRETSGDGEFISPDYGSFVSTAQDAKGWRTIDMERFCANYEQLAEGKEGGIYVTFTIKFANMVSGETFKEQLRFKDTDDNIYALAYRKVVTTGELDDNIMGIRKISNGVTTYPFYVSRTGTLFSQDAYISGTVNASSGSFTGTINATDGVFNGTIYATNGSFNGAITAQSGTIGGFTIVSNDTAGMGQTTANGGHVYPTGLYVHTSATEGGVAYEYETGIRGDAQDHTNAAFYVRRIASGGTWTLNPDDLVFYVRQNGYLYAKDAKISGEINASRFYAKYNDASNSPEVELTSLYLNISNPDYSTWLNGQYVTVNDLSTGGGAVFSRFSRMGSGGFETYNGYAYGWIKGNSVDVAYESTPDDDPYTVRHGRFTASSAGNVGIWDVENQNWIIQSNSSFNVNIPHPLTTNSVQIGATTSTNTKINTGYIDIINTTSSRTCRLVSADSGNIGIYEPNASAYLIYSDSSGVVRVPHMLYCYGKVDETQRAPVGSSNVNNQGVSWFGGTATSTLSVHAQWNASSSATKTIAVSSSDIRLKKDIEDSQVDALEVINRVKVREFTWKDDGVRQKIGVVVDELEELDPLLSVGGGEDENGNPIYKSVNNLLMISYLTKAVQQLSAKVEILQQEIKDLKGDK